VYEDFRRASNIFSVSSGEDGETTNFVKRINPQSFYAETKQPATLSDCLFLLTGGRSMGYCVFHPSASVVEYSGRYQQYLDAQRESLADASLFEIRDFVQNRLKNKYSWHREDTKHLLSHIATVKNKDFFLLNNDPNVRGLRFSDLTDGGKIVFVFRNSLDQFIDYKNKGRPAKDGFEVTPKLFLQYILEAVRNRLRALLLAKVSFLFSTEIMTVHFEDFVASPQVRNSIRVRLGVEAADDPNWVQQSQQNIRLEMHHPISAWQRRTCSILTQIAPIRIT
jgi:hypothetical protein